MIKAMLVHYDFIKIRKLGQPSGLNGTNGIQPEKVEAYYSGISLDLAIAALQSTQSLFLGKTGLGLDDYLIHKKIKREELLLSDIIEDQLETTIATLQTINVSLSLTIAQNLQQVENAYMEIEH